jgi:hypothetical protein
MPANFIRPEDQSFEYTIAELLIEKILDPQLKHEKRPQFFVVARCSGFVFFYQRLDIFGVEQALRP